MSKSDTLAVIIIAICIAFQFMVLIPTVYIRITSEDLLKKDKTILNVLIFALLVTLIDFCFVGYSHWECS